MTPADIEKLRATEKALQDAELIARAAVERVLRRPHADKRIWVITDGPGRGLSVLGEANGLPVLDDRAREAIRAALGDGE